MSEEETLKHLQSLSCRKATGLGCTYGMLRGSLKMGQHNHSRVVPLYKIILKLARVALALCQLYHFFKRVVYNQIETYDI